METTANYNLKKPGNDDFYDVQDFNDNADIIDGAIGAIDYDLGTFETLIDRYVPLETEAQTVIRAINELNSNKVNSVEIDDLVSAGSVLDKIKTVDGSGSGLDADLLDGKEATAFVNGVATGSTADPNTSLESYILTNHANSPGQSLYWHIKTNFYSNKALDANREQTARSYNGTVPAMYIRHYYHQTGWTAWVKMLKEGDKVSAIKSVQRGVVALVGAATSVNVTVSAVNMSNCMIILNGSGTTNSTSGAGAAAASVYSVVVSSTVFSIVRTAGSAYVSGADVGWQLVEYY